MSIKRFAALMTALLLTFAWGAGVTVLFTVAVNALCLRKIRHLKLTDIQ